MLFLKGNNKGLASSRTDLRAFVEFSPLFNVSCEDLQGSCIVQIMKERLARKVCYTILGVPMFENREGHEWSWDDLDQHLKLGCIETYCSLVLGEPDYARINRGFMLNVYNPTDLNKSRIGIRGIDYVIDDDQKKLTFSRMPARFSRDSFSSISLDFFSKFSLMLLPEEIF
ncbi:hypothetical protein VNO77_44044 [Canavalia gladiata]|uniref:Uncharacterized protein n=1 Tax=Canavalia gladiata TaxID=3824 RepID=A0AAN9PQL6_CANGL